MTNEKYFLLSNEHNLGEINIHYNLLETMVINAISEIEGVSKIHKNNIKILRTSNNTKKDINIYTNVNLQLNTNILKISENIQKNIKYNIESLTNLKIDEIIITISNID